MKSKPSYKELERRIQNLKKELAGYKDRNRTNRLNQQYLQAILDNTNLPIYLKDAHFKYILVNRQYEILAHVTNDQIRGKDDFDVFPEPVAQLFRDQDEEVVQRQTLVEFEETITLSDEVHTFLTAKFPLIDEVGNISAVGGVCTDITTLKKKKAELREAEEKYRSIFEYSPLGIFHMNNEGIFTASNQKLADILGSSVEKLIGFNSSKNLKDEKMRAAFASALSGEISRYKGNYRSVTGKRNAYVRCIFSPIHSNDGSIISVIGIIEDITARKKAEVELQEAHDKLEKRVVERTAQLDRKRKKLMETNVALKVLLEKRYEDKQELEEKMMFNIEKLISPYLKKLKMRCRDEYQEALLNIIMSNLDEITSSFTQNQEDFLSKLTPAQIQITDLIKLGHTSKEIATLLDLSPLTIARHRQDIRKRLSLSNKGVNLRTALSTITQ